METELSGEEEMPYSKQKVYKYVGVTITHSMEEIPLPNSQVLH
jgi:hypothetical protein